MANVFFESLHREYRTRRMARFAVWVVAYGVALWLTGRFSKGVPALLWLIFWVTFIPSAVYYVARGIGFIRQRLLWRLRHRLIVTYIFVAVVPILLILFLVGLGAFIMNGQFAAFLVAMKLRHHVDELEALNRALTREARQYESLPPDKLLEQMEKLFINDLRSRLSSYHGLEITFRLGKEVRAFDVEGRRLTSPTTVPLWLHGTEFKGLVLDRDQIVVRALDRVTVPAGELTVIVSQPFSSVLLDSLGAGVGPVEVLAPRVQDLLSNPREWRPVSNFTLSNTEGKPVETMLLRSRTLQVPAPVGRLDVTVASAWALDPVIWGGGLQQTKTSAGLVLVTSRLMALNAELISSLGDLSRAYIDLFLVVAFLFLAIEILALIVSVRLTRSVTTTVDGLNIATERVKRGDFSYRINLPAHDQLSALGEAFDGMTASVERLLIESLEKTRLEGELEIAREVQTRLFPQVVPELPGLRLYGACRPARVVSGDYYDFVQVGGNRVVMALGDISGKGISAALLMAAIQSALHAQFYDGRSAPYAGEAVPLTAADVVARLNRQLFASTPREKYATFFYAVYDAPTRQLVYTNAGHPAPFFFHRGKVERLTTGGTVMGLFGRVNYNQAVVQMEVGDLLVAFTDGIFEPENSFGEEYGEQRLLSVVERAAVSSPQSLVEEVYRSVSDWTGSPELQDDMTLMVAQAVA